MNPDRIRSPLRALPGCLVLFIGSWIGLMIATAGFAVYPPVANIAAPFVCSGTLDHESHGATYRPGEYIVTRQIFCVAPDGKARAEVTFTAVAVSFVLYSAIATALLGLLLALRKRRRRHAGPDLPPGARTGGAAGIGAILARAHSAVERGEARVVVRDVSVGGEGAGDIAARLAELKRLRDSGLITEADYEAKKAEILSGL